MALEEKAMFYLSMSRTELIEYCDLHSRTPRALFRYDQVAQMVEFAGRPSDWSSPEEIMGEMKLEKGQDKPQYKFISLHEGMRCLVNLARQRG